MKRLGPVSYLMNAGVRKRTVHINHLLLSHGEIGDCNNSRDDTYLTPNLDSKQPISIQEAEGRIVVRLQLTAPCSHQSASVRGELQRQGKSGVSEYVELFKQTAGLRM